MLGYFGFYGWYYDPTYILLIIGMIICLIATANVKATFNKYSKVKSMSGMTGAMAADKILKSNGLFDVKITHIAGNLSDNYNPKTKTLSLSDSTYNSTSVAAIGVAAHECGHALQHEQEYGPLKLRSAMVPAANIGSRASMIFVILGFVIGIATQFGYTVAFIGIVLFLVAVLFQVVTLPVEFDASKRALASLESCGILYNDEIKQSRKVLKAAAMTYVASLLSAVLSLLRIVLLVAGGKRRD